MQAAEVLVITATDLTLIIDVVVGLTGFTNT